MLLIVGLGNPGEKYKDNRHNVGFQFIDFIAPLLHCSIVKQTKNFITMKQLNNGTIVLSKPQTFMNLSGKAVKQLNKMYGLTSNNLTANNLVIIHDDLDIPIGKFKIQKGVGPQLHNGLESIEKELGTKNFWRIRIGIDNRPAHRSLGEGGIDGETYVLDDFKEQEKKIVLETFPKIFIRLKTEFFTSV